MSVGLKAYSRGTLFFGVILFVLLCIMSWCDVTSSNQAGLRDVDRGNTHLVIACVVALHGIYVMLKCSKNRYGKFVNLLLACISLWFLFVDFLRGAPRDSSGAMILLSLWWIFSYNFSYSFCRKQGERLLLLLYLGMFLFWVYLNEYARSQIILNFGRENAVTGYAYYLLIFIPYIFLMRDSWIKKSLLLVSIYMILTSFKRGTMVTLPVMLLVYGYLKGNIEGNLSRFFKYVCIIGIVAFTVIPIIDRGSGGFLSERFSEEELESGSGRTENREKAMRAVAERGTIDFLLGSGHGSSVVLLGTGVHNEWVEFLFSFGLIGAFLYFCLGICFLRQCFFFYKKRSRYAPHMGMMMAYFYMVSLFSGFIGVYVTYYFFVFMGIITYLNEQEIRACKRIRA